MKKIKQILLTALVSFCACTANSQGTKPGYAHLYVYNFEYKAWFEKNNIKKCIITSEIEVIKTEKGYKKDRYGDDPTVEIIQLKKTNSGKIYSYRYGKDIETYTYNNSGQLIKHFRIDEDGYTEKIIYTYNLDGHLANLKKYSRGVLSVDFTLVYDQKGRLIEEKRHTKVVSLSGETGYSDETIIFTYDDKNRWIGSIHYNADKTKGDQLKINYKEGGKRVEITQKSGYLTSFVPDITYVYDDRGNEIEILNYNYGGSTLNFKLVYKYNGDDQIEISQRYNENNKVPTTEEFSYNEHNDVLKLTSTGFNANETTYEYVYDKNGIWTEQVRCKKSKYTTKFMMTKRKISYN